MIPKVIHWCWLSNDPIPAFIQTCINSWKKELPDYEIKQWNTKNFDINSVSYVKQAVDLKKWAFACDYIRAYALYTEGGIYLDSDVFVRKNFDFVLNNRAFSAMECYPERIEEALKLGLIDVEGNKNPSVRFVHGAQIQAAILGSEKGHPFFKDILDYYQNHSFVKGDGTIDDEMISPFIYANEAVKYGFKFINKEQSLSEGFKLYDVTKFAPLISTATNAAYAIHCCNGSWRKLPKTGFAAIFSNIKESLKKILSKLNIYDEARVKDIESLD